VVLGSNTSTLAHIWLGDRTWGGRYEVRVFNDLSASRSLELWLLKLMLSLSPSCSIATLCMGCQARRGERGHRRVWMDDRGHRGCRRVLITLCICFRNRRGDSRVLMTLCIHFRNGRGKRGHG
jgi:hypothetical protein